MQSLHDEAYDLGELLTHPRATLNVGHESIRLSVSGTLVFEGLLDDDLYEEQDGDNPHGI